MERTKAILVRVTAEEHQQIRELAAKAGQSMGAYGRLKLLAPPIPIAAHVEFRPAPQVIADAKPVAHIKPAELIGLGVAKRIRDDKGNRL